MRRREILRRRRRRPGAVGPAAPHPGRADVCFCVGRTAARLVVTALALCPAQLAAQTSSAAADDDAPGWNNAAELSIVRTGGNADTQTLGFGGVGNTWIDRESTGLATAYGVSYTSREELVADGAKADHFAGFRIDSDYRQRLGTITSVDGALTLNVSLVDRSDYSVKSTSGVAVAMTDHLSLRISLQWLYEHQPAFEEAAIVALVALRDPDGAPGSGDELFETVADGGLAIDLGTGHLRKDGLDTILRTALVISF